MRRWWTILLLLGQVTAVSAGTTMFPNDTLESCTSGCSTVANTKNANLDVYSRGVFQVIVTGTVDAKLQNSIDGGVTWTDVTGAACTGCSTSVPTKWPVSGPVGLYAFSVGTCTACTYKCTYRAAR